MRVTGMRVAVHLGLLATAVAVLPLASTVRAQESEPKAVPRASCAPGSLPETGRQGRVSPADRISGKSAKGYRCNAEVVASFGSAGGFETLRYVDSGGPECAYFDVPPPARNRECRSWT